MAATSRTPKSRTRNLIDSKSTGSTSTTISSSFFKSVYLEDWWLIKARGKGIAVGGFSNSETQGVRLFCSAAIATRYDTTTLYTKDGFNISISGFINRSRSHENGFSAQVCNRFVLGFPYDWEEVAAPFIGEKTSEGCAPNRGSAFDKSSSSFVDIGNSFLPCSFDEIPVNRVRDILMASLDDSGNSAVTKGVYDDIVEKLKVNSVQDHTPIIHEKAKSNRSKKGRDVLTEDYGITTRHTKRRKSTRLNQ